MAAWAAKVAGLSTSLIVSVPLLLKAGELTPIEKAERRVLVLANPGHGLENMQASAAIYLGMQLLLPGEWAPAHRHTPNAVRMVVEGKGAYTTLGNNQMLAADPVSGEVRRFLVGPRGCEITGIAYTPSLTDFFVNIQHPTGNWPIAGEKPRSSTIVVTDCAIASSRCSTVLSARTAP